LESRRLLLLALAGGIALASPAPARAALLFSHSPTTPLTHVPVTFTAQTGGVTAWRWAFDGGACDSAAQADATGPRVRRSFPFPGTVGVRLCVDTLSGQAEELQRVAIRNRPPLASFATTLAAPRTGELITFASTSRDLDGPIAAQSWDLDGDGAFDDGTAAMASRSFGRPGAHVVGLRVTDAVGARASSVRTVWISARLLSPFPVVRLLGTIRGAWTHIRRLSVRAPPGSVAEVRCRGRRRGCPRNRRQRARNRRVKRMRTIRFRRFERRLRARAVLEVRVTKPGTIGKYTRFRIRRGRRPARRDRCIMPGARRPQDCPP
jgi:hypothetical protein